MGRQLQESFGQEPQVVLMTPLLEGTDGVRKMSKSLGNYIGVEDSPDDIVGKVMSINDDLMLKYYEILTDEDLNQVKGLHPKEAKLQLGERIVALLYDEGKAKKAREAFEKVFSSRELPDSMPEYALKGGENLVEILISAGLAASKNEVRRLLKQGAITHEGAKMDAENWAPKAGVLKVGKRRFLRLR